jgi:hypothetical protein
MGIFDIFTGAKPSQRKVTAHLLDPKAGHTAQEWIVGQDVEVETVNRFARDGHLYIAIAYKGGEPVLTVCDKAIWESARMEFDAINLRMTDSPSLQLLREFEKREGK